MWLLFLYTDVNSNFFCLTKDKLKLHINHFISSIQLLFTCHFREYGQLAGGYIGFIKRLPRVRKSISTNRTIGCNWLNIYVMRIIKLHKLSARLYQKGYGKLASLISAYITRRYRCVIYPQTHLGGVQYSVMEGSVW